MEVSFETIGLEILNEQAFNSLVEDTKLRGEVSRLVRQAGIIHGRCWRLGAGLEVWTILYVSDSGEIFHADCRPAFRARFDVKINRWLMTEFDKSCQALIQGCLTGTDTELVFALQNLTEANLLNFQEKTLAVGLCGLAQSVSVVKKNSKRFARMKKDSNGLGSENILSLCGEVLDFEIVRNPYSGNDLYWIYLKLPDLQLEIIVNKRNLEGLNLERGATVKAEVWLQGHLTGKRFFQRYEGVDYRFQTADFWQQLKRSN